MRVSGRPSFSVSSLPALTQTQAEVGLTDAMLVWLANMTPLTLFSLPACLRLVSATWMLAGPHGIKLASCRSRIRRSDLCTSVGSTSPAMILRHET